MEFISKEALSYIVNSAISRWNICLGEKSIYITDEDEKIVHTTNDIVDAIRNLGIIRAHEITVEIIKLIS